MINQCSNCDKILSANQKICECGYSLHFYQKVVKVINKCSVNGTKCFKDGLFPVKTHKGETVWYCENHYDKIRPKSDIEKEMEKRIMDMRHKLNSKPGWPRNIKKLMEI